MKLQLTHLRILVSHYQNAFLFYRDILQLDVDWGDENSGYAELSTGYIKLALLPKEVMNQALGITEPAPSSPSQDKITIVFAVDNVDEVYERLKAHHASLVTPPLDRPEWGIRTAHFRDPDGNLIEIYTNLGIVS